jgi:membrane protein YqaA with SNARE-associated domain
LAATGIRADIWTPFIDLLNTVYSIPLLYGVLVFFYAILVAIVLPIPIEFALFPPILAQSWLYLAGVAIALASGKTVGAALVFRLGIRIEDKIQKWSDRWRLARWFVAKAQRFVAKTQIPGLYLILSVPLLPDTITIYLYSLFNPEGRVLERNMFLIANFLAALNRTAFVVIAYLVFDTFLF